MAITLEDKNVVESSGGSYRVPVYVVGGVALTLDTGTPLDVNVANIPTVNIGTMPSVTLAGTADVSVVNTPNVSIQGTPNVAISGTPSFNVANTPTVNIGTMPSVSMSRVFSSLPLTAGVQTLQPGTYIKASGGAVDLRFTDSNSQVWTCYDSQFSLNSACSFDVFNDVTFNYCPVPSPGMGIRFRKNDTIATGDTGNDRSIIAGFPCLITTWDSSTLAISAAFVPGMLPGDMLAAASAGSIVVYAKAEL